MTARLASRKKAKDKQRLSRQFSLNNTQQTSTLHTCNVVVVLLRHSLLFSTLQAMSGFTRRAIAALCPGLAVSELENRIDSVQKKQLYPYFLVATR